MDIDTHQFLSIVIPALEEGDPTALARQVRRRWSAGQVARLLRSPDIDARRCAALILGLIGTAASIGPLSRALHDPDEQVHQMAEHAMWTIWFRGCDCQATAAFERGAAGLADEQYDQAIDAFTEALARCPDFAEALNQRAIAHHLAGNHPASAADCRRVLKMAPAHFGAAAGLGHSLCHLGDLAGGLQAYRRALAINPRMPEIARTVERLETRLAAETLAPAATDHPAPRL